MTSGGRRRWHNVTLFAQSCLNKQAAIIIEAVDYDADGYCNISVGWHEWAITLFDRPQTMKYLLDRAATPWINR